MPFVDLLWKNTVCSLSFTLKVTFPLLQSITAPAVLRKGLPRMMDMLLSSVMSSTTKSISIKQLATSTGTSSQIPIGTAVDLSAICREISLGISDGINPGKSHGQGPWVSYRKHRLDDKLVGKQKDTFLLDILMMEVWLQWMPRLERSGLGLQMMLDNELSLALPLLAFI